MKISLKPMAEPGIEPYASGLSLVKKSESALEVNGETFDFLEMPPGSLLPDGSQATGSPWFFGPVRMTENGQLQVEIWLPHSADASEKACFPEPIIDPADGPIQLPETDWPPVAPAAPIEPEDPSGIVASNGDML